jgi:hypothetical protein
MNPLRHKSSLFWLVIMAVFSYFGYLTSCTQKDQVLLTDPTSENTTDLISLKATTAPAIDGNIDAV